MSNGTTYPSAANIYLLSQAGKPNPPAPKKSWFLEWNHLLQPTQAGFRPGRSTIDHIVALENHTKIGFSKGSPTTAIFLDIVKAILKWTKSFLTGRTARIRIGDHLSEAHPVTRGVPQGAVLSPLLFNVMMSDLPPPPPGAYTLQNIISLLTNQKFRPNINTLTTLFKSVVRSKVDYGAIAYGGTCSTNIAKIDIVCHGFLRMILGAFKSTSLSKNPKISTCQPAYHHINCPKEWPPRSILNIYPMLSEFAALEPNLFKAHPDYFAQRKIPRPWSIAPHKTSYFPMPKKEAMENQIDQTNKAKKLCSEPPDDKHGRRTSQVQGTPCLLGQRRRRRRRLDGSIRGTTRLQPVDRRRQTSKLRHLPRRTSKTVVSMPDTTQQQAGTPAISGMRSIFIKEFLQDSYAGYQERKLRNHKQGINEPAAEYYYEIINLCRLIDPNMSEEAKLHHLYEGLKPTLVEKIWVLQPKTCIDFLTATSCLVYLDDIIVYARDTKEHIRRLRLVLAALCKANLKLKLVKCRFGESAIIALGHKINADGISPDPGKVRAVQNFPTPPTTASRAEKVKFIKSFLGLCSYYRRHIPGFAEAAKPLFDLTREKSLFIWTPTHQERFDKLKQMLADSATLAYPDPTAEFEIHPDACGYGVGGQNYSITEKECLTIIWAIKKFRQFIFGSPIRIVTDHHALCWLQSKTELAGRLARWAMTISEYKYVIAHKDGKLHQDADALSRYPVSEDDVTLDNTWVGHVNKVGVMTQDNREELTRGQQAEWAYVFRNAENGKETVNYTIENGLLYRMRRTGEEEADVELRLCIPKDLKTTILQACHDDVTSGHHGETRTHDRVTQRYYWHGITRDIENYIKACPDCQSRKKGKYRKPPGFLELTQVEKPWDRVGMDILGPFPTSSLGNRYIIVAVDYVTKWAEAVTLPVAGAEQVAEFFVKEILL
ncbi:Uncharacterized protein APZ42_023098 [Daphnia magna]|uniref:RNA-directed DNA polymerase n=1 Tax=Daphnia magna TaxID=35525 RepID=A0A164V6G6_9CRUS|nr:Uncharacterized protein APZ42_023098 [Daphnia magna]